MLSMDDERYGKHDFFLNDQARQMVRLSFNPSNLSTVDRLKILAAAFLSEIDKQQAEGAYSAPAPREFAIARTHMQTACMFSVAAATSHLGK